MHVTPAVAALSSDNAPNLPSLHRQRMIGSVAAVLRYLAKQVMAGSPQLGRTSLLVELQGNLANDKGIGEHRRADVFEALPRSVARRQRAHLL